MSFEEFAEKFADEEIDNNRLQSVLGLLSGPKWRPDLLPIRQYVFKVVFPEQYEALMEQDVYADGENHLYDTAKNGKNIVKHGISFDELLSYAGGNGTVIVPIVVRGEERRAVFWRLSASAPLRFPLNPPIQGGRVLSIVKPVGERFRFISARVVSENERDHRMAAKSQLKDVEDLAVEDRPGFLQDLLDIIARNHGEA